MSQNVFCISVSEGRKAPRHDKREGEYPKNADKSLQAHNKTIISTPGNYVADFNAYFKGRNALSNKAKSDYYDYLTHESKNGEQPFYEFVLQIGNHDDNGIQDWNSPESRKARKALDNAAAKLQERYPAFKFWFIGSHGDEPNGTYHYHICFTPVGEGYKNGMPVRCSLRQALKSMGLQKSGGYWKAWKADCEHLIQAEMEQLGLERGYRDDKSRRLDTPDYKRTELVKDAETAWAEGYAMKEEGEEILKQARKAKKDNENEAKRLEAEKSILEQQKADFALEKQIFEQNAAAERKALDDERDALEQLRSDMFADKFKKSADGVKIARMLEDAKQTEHHIPLIRRKLDDKAKRGSEQIVENPTIYERELG